MRWVYLIVLTVVAGCGGKRDTGGTEPAAPPPAPEVTVTGEQLYRDYLDGKLDPVNAKYLGKYVKVRGRVHAVEEVAGGFLVGVETGPNAIGGGVERKAAVVGVVSTAAKDAVSQLKSGDEIVLIGKCTGKEADDTRRGGVKIALTDARIEAHYPR